MGRELICGYWGSWYCCLADIWSMRWHIRSAFEDMDVI